MAKKKDVLSNIEAIKNSLLTAFEAEYPEATTETPEGSVIGLLNGGMNSYFPKDLFPQGISLNNSEIPEILANVKISIENNEHPLQIHRGLATLVHEISEKALANQNPLTKEQKTNVEQTLVKALLVDNKIPSLNNITGGEEGKILHLENLYALSTGKTYHGANEIIPELLNKLQNQDIHLTMQQKEYLGGGSFWENLPSDTLMLSDKALSALSEKAGIEHKIKTEDHPFGKDREIATILSYLPAYALNTEGYQKITHEEFEGLRDSFLSRILDDKNIKKYPLLEALPAESRKEAITEIFNNLGKGIEKYNEILAGFKPLAAATTTTTITTTPITTNPNPQPEKIAFHKSQTTWLAAGLTGIAAWLGFGGKKEKEEEGVEGGQKEKTNWLSSRRIATGLMLVGAGYLAVQVAKGNDPIGTFTSSFGKGGADKSFKR